MVSLTFEIMLKISSSLSSILEHMWIKVWPFKSTVGSKNQVIEYDIVCKQKNSTSVLNIVVLPTCFKIQKNEYP